jgi:hypothetical protein
MVDDVEEFDDEKLATKKKKLLVDWKLGNSFCGAFWKGKLPRNDYQVISSAAIFIILIVVMAIVIMIDEESSIGITIAVPFLHFAIAFGALVRSIAVDSPVGCKEYVLLLIAYGGQYAWGVIYYNATFDSDTEEGSNGGKFLVGYVLVLPFISAFIITFNTWYDNSWKLTVFITIFIAITIIKGIAIIVCGFIAVGAAQGFGVLGVVALFTYIAIISFIYVKNDYFLPRAWSIINIFICLSIAFIAFIVSLATDTMSVFAGLSITLGILCVIPLIWSIFEIYKDL